MSITSARGLVSKRYYREGITIEDKASVLPKVCAKGSASTSGVVQVDLRHPVTGETLGT